MVSTTLPASPFLPTSPHLPCHLAPHFPPTVSSLVQLLTTTRSIDIQKLVEERVARFRQYCLHDLDMAHMRELELILEQMTKWLSIISTAYIHTCIPCTSVWTSVCTAASYLSMYMCNWFTIRSNVHACTYVCVPVMSLLCVWSLQAVHVGWRPRGASWAEPEDPVQSWSDYLPLQFLHTPDTHTCARIRSNWLSHACFPIIVQWVEHTVWYWHLHSLLANAPEQRYASSCTFIHWRRQLNAVWCIQTCTFTSFEWKLWCPKMARYQLLQRWIKWQIRESCNWSKYKMHSGCLTQSRNPSGAALGNHLQQSCAQV